MTIEIVSQIILKSKMPSRSQKELHHVSEKRAKRISRKIKLILKSLRIYIFLFKETVSLLLKILNF
jgi:hypothetical protein